VFGHPAHALVLSEADGGGAALLGWDSSCWCLACRGGEVDRLRCRSVGRQLIEPQHGVGRESQWLQGGEATAWFRYDALCEGLAATGSDETVRNSVCGP